MDERNEKLGRKSQNGKKKWENETEYIYIWKKEIIERHITTKKKGNE